MKFFTKMYFENKRLKKKLEKCEEELNKSKQEYNRLFFNKDQFRAGCENCIHGLPYVTDSTKPYGCAIWQKMRCDCFVRKVSTQDEVKLLDRLKDATISLKKEEQAVQSASEGSIPQDRQGQ